MLLLFINVTFYRLLELQLGLYTLEGILEGRCFLSAYDLYSFGEKTIICMSSIMRRIELFLKLLKNNNYNNNLRSIFLTCLLITITIYNEISINYFS